VCCLTFDHPQFDRIRTTLEQAIANGARVWLANRMHRVKSETEIWWKLMDVRPLESVPRRRKGRRPLPADVLDPTRQDTRHLLAEAGWG
jgi:hypothetical protein